jgi:hypothetical protein
MLLLRERAIRSAIASQLAYTDIGVVPAVPASRCVVTRGDGVAAAAAAAAAPRHCLRVGTASGCKAYAWARADEMTVAFRGSVGARDIAAFFDLERVDYRFRESRASVHAGVLRAFDEVERELTPLILPPERGHRAPSRLTFTGHSLGGALAMFAAAYYASMTPLGRCRVACHSFGAFRPGDSAFSEWYAASVDESLVLANSSDLVVHLPPRCLGYADVTKGKHDFARGLGRHAHTMDTYIAYLQSFPRPIIA